jgi:hypothetical protein
MRTIRRSWFGFVLVLFVAAWLSCSLDKPAAVQAEGAANTTVEVKVIKYPDLVAALKENKGKVLVVDCWALT